MYYIDDQTGKMPCLTKPVFFLTFLSLLCCGFDSIYLAVVCYGPVTVTNCHTVSNIQLLTYLLGKCASSNSSTDLWVHRETRSCLDVIPEAVLFCFGNSTVCFEVLCFMHPQHSPPLCCAFLLPVDTKGSLEGGPVPHGPSRH